MVAPCWYNLDLHPGNRPRLTQRRATKVNLGLDRLIGKVKWAVCLLGSKAKENSETCASYHYGTLRGTLQQTYPCSSKVWNCSSPGSETALCSGAAPIAAAWTGSSRTSEAMRPTQGRGQHRLPTFYVVELTEAGLSRSSA